MTRRALLVGAQTAGLSGPDDDVAAMAAGLRRFGFTDLRPCTGPAATRDGIVAAYESLIADTEPGDVALFYYSGHGSYVRPLPGETVEVAANNRQFIVPTDYREPFGDDFRGITAVELSLLLRRLTDRTNNAVVVLDCCHSARMSRTLGHQVPKQRSRASMLDLARHLRRRLGAQTPEDLTDPLGNRRAVRIVACQAEQVAYEQHRWDGSGAYGLLTDAFLQALDESAQTPVSWSRLIERIRSLVQEAAPHQRPDVEGPAHRRLFEEESDDAAGSLPAVQDGHRVRLPGAALLGVQVGDRFAIMPGNAVRAAAEGRLATVEIDHCDPEAASGPLPPLGSGAALPIDARAFRTWCMAPRVAVAVPESLAAAIGTCTFARPAEAGDKAPFRVVASAGGLTLHDAYGPLLHTGTGPDGLHRLVTGVERATRATALRKIRAESGWSTDAPVDIEWGLVRDGHREPLPQADAEVNVGDRVYIDVRNRSGGDLYVSMLDIGVSYGIKHLTHRAGSGDRFAKEASHVFGWSRRDQRLTGRALTWPEGLDAASSRPETILVIVTTRPYDVTSLIQPPVRGASRSTAANGLLAHFLTGTCRDFADDDTDFCVASVEFILNPPAGEAS